MKRDMTEIRDYTWPVTSVNREDYEAAKECIVRISEIQKKIIIFGAGIRGCMLYKVFERYQCPVYAFTDNNQEKWGGFIFEKQIIPVSELQKMRNDVIVVISVENGYSIKAQVEAMGYTEGLDYFFIYTRSYDWYMRQFHEKMSNHTLVMGDCGLLTISMNDKIDLTLGDMLIKDWTDSPVKVLAMHGIGMRAHYNVLKTQLFMGMKPKRIILMVNFDTMTGKQHLLPRSQHPDLIDRIQEESACTDPELLEYVKVTRERFENIQVEFFTSAEGNAAEKDDNQKRLYFMLNYMYNLKMDNEGVQYLFRIIALAHQQGIQLIPYIPPVNYMLAEKVVGDAFFEKYNRNREKMKSWLEERNVRCLDMSYDLKDNEFAEVTTADETCNYEGRYKMMRIMQDNLDMNER